jgi:hypothetical protein
MPRRLVLALAAVVVVAAITVMWTKADDSQCSAVPANGVIARSGRYCLDRNQSVSRSPGIDVTAANVTLDLSGGGLTFKGDDARSVGIVVRESATNARIVGGVVENFGFGLEGSGKQLRVESVTFREIGAIAMMSRGDGARLTGNTIDGVGARPLAADNAYAIGANVIGRNVLLQKNIIRGLRRQAVDPKIVGEAVGVLVGDECQDCIVLENQIATKAAEPRSIGIWNSGTGKVEITRNQLTGFNQGIVSLGHAYVIHGNEIGCVDAAGSMGVVMSLGRNSAGDGEGSAMANKYSSCAIEQMICNNGCKAEWSTEIAQRLWQQSRRDR